MLVAAGTHAAHRLRLEHIHLDEEVDEEQKVGEVGERRQLQILIGHLALGLRMVRERVVDDEVGRHAGNHLQDLHGGQHLRDDDGQLDARRTTRVVGVHDRVNDEIHGGEPAAARAAVLVADEAEYEHGGVMVPVEEDERLLPQHDEHGVEELEELAQHEPVAPGARYAVQVARVAYGGDNALGRQRVHELGHEADGADQAKHGQEDVPEDEWHAEVEGGPRLHVRLTHVHGSDVEERDGQADEPVVVDALHQAVDMTFGLEGRLQCEYVRVGQLGLVRHELGKVADRTNVEQRREHGSHLCSMCLNILLLFLQIFLFSYLTMIWCVCVCLCAVRLLVVVDIIGTAGCCSSKIK